MKDFDDIFRKKLQEEGEYANRVKNWERLNERLDAFADGGSHFNPHNAPISGLKYWLIGQSIALIGLLTFAGLIWRDNIALRQKVEDLTSSVQQLSPVVQPAEAITPISATAATLNKSGALAHTIKPENATPSFTTTPAITQTDALVNESKAAQPAFFQQPATTLQPVTAEKNISPSASTENQQAALMDNATDKVLKPEIDNTDATVGQVIDPAHESGSVNLNQTDSATNIQTSAPDTIATVKDSVSALPLPPVVLPAKLPVKVKQEEKPVEKATPVASIIQPAGRRFGFKAGIEGLGGKIIPSEETVSYLIGQGLHVAASIPHTPLWLKAGVESWRLEEYSAEFMQRFHRGGRPPMPPDDNNGGGGGNHTHYELALVESSVRQQRFSLGLHYDLPQIWRFKPFINASHSWVRTPEHKVTYTFEERDDPGGPGHGMFDEKRYLIETVPTHYASNQLLLGAGFQFMMKQWSIDLQGLYQENLGVNENSFNAMFIKAGLTHHF